MLDAMCVLQLHVQLSSVIIHHERDQVCAHPGKNIQV